LAAASPLEVQASAVNQRPFERVLPPQRALALPLAFAVGLLAVALLSPVRENPKLIASVSGAAAALLMWNVVLLVLTLRCQRMLTLDIVIRKQHYLQACAQGSVLLYWRWYWRPVYESAA